MLKLTYITTHIRLPATGCSLVGVVDAKGVHRIGSLYNVSLTPSRVQLCVNKPALHYRSSAKTRVTVE